jgi:hypothetical protein
MRVTDKHSEATMIQADNEIERAVLSFLDTLSTGELERIRAWFVPDAVWQVQARAIPGAGTHKGRDVIVDKFLAPIRGMFVPGDPKIQVRALASKGPLVLAEIRGTGRLADGRPYDNLYAWAFEVRDGKIATIREYMDSHYIMTLVSPETQRAPARARSRAARPSARRAGRRAAARKVGAKRKKTKSKMGKRKAGGRRS